jgi:hypothetical protein
LLTAGDRHASLVAFSAAHHGLCGLMREL